MKTVALEEGYRRNVNSRQAQRCCRRVEGYFSRLSRTDKSAFKLVEQSLIRHDIAAQGRDDE